MPVYKSKFPTADGRDWYFQKSYVDRSGFRKQKRSKCYPTKLDAMKAEYEFLIRMEETGIDLPVSMNFSSLFKTFLAEKRKTAKAVTIKCYINRFEKFECFHKTKCVDFTADMFEEWKKEMLPNGDYSMSYKNDLVKFWRILLNFGSLWYGFDFSDSYDKLTLFVKNKGIQRRIDFYAEQEVKKFLRKETDLRYRCLWQSFFFAGLKTGEARGLTWNCISFKNKTLTIKQQLVYSKKTSAEDKCYSISKLNSTNNVRKITLNKTLRRNLKKYYRIVSELDGFDKKTWFVFGEDFGRKPFSMKHVYDRNNEITRLARVKTISLKDFRHTCAYLLIKSGANIMAVARFLGYVDINEAMRVYSFMLPMAMTDVIDIINGLNNAEKL